MKKLILIILVLTVISTMLILPGCAKKDDDTSTSSDSSDKSAGDDKTYELKVGMVVTEQDPMYLGAMELKKNVEERTGGKLKIEVFPSSQLGDTKDIQEQAKVGSNVAVITDPALLAEIVPEIGVLGAPYVTDSYDESVKLVKSDLFKSWADKLGTGGYKLLSFNWYQGERHFLTNKKINSMADLKGLRIRTPGAAIWTDSINSMGASATSLAWGEVYPGLQQKVIDGAEAQLPAIVGAKLQETIGFITKTRHFQLMTGLVTSDKWFNELPEDYQKILVEESDKAGDFASEKTIESLADYEKQIKDAGVEIDDIDIEEFKKASEVVYEKNNLQDAKKEVDELLGK